MAKLLLAVSATLAGGAAGLRQRQENCGADDINFAAITLNSCSLNWDLREKAKIEKSRHVGDHKGCWERLAYNTDKFMSSTLYQNKQDGRCALGFSGYHGALAGYIRGAFALTWPPKSERACGRMLFSPYLRLLRHHTNLSNWSSMVHLFAGPDRVCQGEVTLTAESMGGSAGEMLAWCGNNGRLADVQSPSLPNYTIETLFTFGAPASAVEPLNNTLREDGCFKGKRILYSSDPIAKFNRMFNVKHPRMDAVIIYPGKKPAVKIFACASQEAISDGMNGKKPKAAMANDTLSQKDPMSHAVSSYMDTIRYMNAHGLADLFDEQPLHLQPNTSAAARYLAMFRRSES